MCSHWEPLQICERRVEGWRPASASPSPCSSSARQDAVGAEGVSLAIQLGREGHDVMGRAMREVPAMASMEEFRKYLFVWLNPFSTYTDPKRVRT